MSLLNCQLTARPLKLSLHNLPCWPCTLFRHDPLKLTSSQMQIPSTQNLRGMNKRKSLVMAASGTFCTATASKQFSFLWGLYGRSPPLLGGPHSLATEGPAPGHIHGWCHTSLTSLMPQDQHPKALYEELEHQCFSMVYYVYQCFSMIWCPQNSSRGGSRGSSRRVPPHLIDFTRGGG